MGTYQVKEEVVKIGLGYASTIKLINISYYYVGPFFCVTNETQSDYDYSDRISSNGPHSQRRNKNGLTSINSVYVYVDGKMIALLTEFPLIRCVNIFRR